MKYLDNIKFQFYPADIEKTSPIGVIALRQFIQSHKNPSGKVLELFDNIEKASAIGDKALKSELKKQLFCFTPGVFIKKGGRRRYCDIESYTGLFQGDFDGITNAESFKEFIFNNYPSVVCAYLSPSRLGVKLIVRIPICNSVEEVKEYIYGFFSEVEKYRGFDPAPKNICLPLFLSYDKDILYREEPEIWTKKGVQINEFDLDKIDLDFEAEDLASDNLKLEIVKLMKNMINLANTEQNGHKNVVRASLVMGGMSAYYKNIDENEVLDYLIECIESCDYLKKDLNGYKKTAKTLFRTGTLSPIPLKNA